MDRDLAELYGVETKVLKQAVRRALQPQRPNESIKNSLNKSMSPQSYAFAAGTVFWLLPGIIPLFSKSSLRLTLEKIIIFKFLLNHFDGSIDFKIKILGALSVVGVLQYTFLPLAFPKSLS